MRKSRSTGYRQDALHTLRACMCAYKLTSAKIPQVPILLYFMVVSLHKKGSLESKRDVQNHSPVMNLILNSYFFFPVNLSSVPVLTFMGLYNPESTAGCEGKHYKLNDRKWPVTNGLHIAARWLVSAVASARHFSRRQVAAMNLPEMPWCSVQMLVNLETSGLPLSGVSIFSLFSLSNTKPASRNCNHQKGWPSQITRVFHKMRSRIFRFWVISGAFTKK